MEANADVFLFGERGKVAPRGIVGGGDAATNRFVYEQADGEHTPPMVSKMVGIHITRGQKLRLETPGGGGYGNALDRPPDAVLADVTLGYVSAEVASDSYGVVIAVDGTLDAGATAALRKERAA